jgi:hypothetical protein
MLATIALGVAVALVAGFAIGYKIDDSNGGGSGAKKTAAKSTGKGKGKKAPRLKEAPTLIGSVSALTARRLVVLGPDDKSYRVGTGRKTRTVLASTGKTSDIKVGSRVLFQASPSSKTTAIRVIVLPDNAQLGQDVTAVEPGASMTLQALSGPEKIGTSDAAVLVTAKAKRSNISKGSKVIVHYFVVKGKRKAATDVIVLPDGSKFA